MDPPNNQVWMGSLESYMTEHFIFNCFRECGENPRSVKIMKDMTGKSLAFCIINFKSEVEATSVIHKLNGRIVPKTFPPVRFKLNHFLKGSRPVTDKDFKIFVKELSEDVDDYALFKFFSRRFRSVRTAKVAYDNTGRSKGIALVRFGSEAEQKKCLKEMNGLKGLGSKPIQVGCVTPTLPRRKGTDELPPVPKPAVPVYNYYNSPASYQPYCWPPSYYQHAMVLHVNNHRQEKSYEGSNPMEQIEHTASVNVDEMNEAILTRGMDFWDSLENSKWSPLDPIELQSEVLQ